MSETRTVMQKYKDAYGRLKVYAVKNKMGFYEALTFAIVSFLKSAK